MGHALTDRVKETLKTEEELRDDAAWCEKMLVRTRRSDPEGLFRHHRVLTEGAMKAFYRGPKKTLRLMERTDERGCALYTEALRSFGHEAPVEWVKYLRTKVSR